jgi:invasion protein IalB
MRKSRAIPAENSTAIERVQSLATGAIVLCALIMATPASSQQVVPFGDVPATPDFSEVEIAARGQQPARDLTYSDWSKMCFKGVQGADPEMVCRTTISGKWNTGQVALRFDLIEREDDAAKRLQIFLPAGFFLQPGIKLTVDKGSSINVPYTICLANGCVAATVADPSFVSALESGRVLSLDGVNANVVTVISSLPLDNFAKTYQGPPAQVFEQKLEGKWEKPADGASTK